jgi:MFS family permease
VQALQALIDPLTGPLQTFAVFAVGFVARPISAAIFGHYGDRIGRKAAPIATLLLTGLRRGNQDERPYCLTGECYPVRDHCLI